MRIGAAVLHYRFWPELRPALDSLLAQTRAADEIVVVDNGSDDGSPDAIADAYPGLDLVRSSPNLGPIAGMNIAIDTLLARDVDALLLLTHETLLASDALAALARRLEQDERIGVVGPLLSYLSRPGDLWSAGGRVDRRNWDTGHIVEPRALAAWRGRPSHRVDWLDGACLLLRADAVRAAGRLHADYFLLFDEPDYQLRLSALGWRAECVPAAVAWQEPGTQPPYMFVRNRLGFLARRAPRRFVAREIARVSYHALRDCVRPRRGSYRVDAVRRVRGMLDFVRGRWGRPAAELLRAGPRE